MKFAVVSPRVANILTVDPRGAATSSAKPNWFVVTASSIGPDNSRKTSETLFPVESSTLKTSVASGANDTTPKIAITKSNSKIKIRIKNSANEGTTSSTLSTIL